MNLTKAIDAIEAHGALLVFPIKNAKEPHSLWSVFYPRSKMRWEWDDDGDNRVAQLWALMKELSDGGEVVYSKWYQGRATFFSRELFVAMLRVSREHHPRIDIELSPAARLVYETLLDNSPVSTKKLKLYTDMQGRERQGDYDRALKLLFRQLLIVGFGEVDDGAFPSLAVGATKVLFEAVWQQASALELAAAQKIVETYLKEGSAFRRFYLQTLRAIPEKDRKRGAIKADDIFRSDRENA